MDSNTHSHIQLSLCDGSPSLSRETAGGLVSQRPTAKCCVLEQFCSTSPVAVKFPARSSPLLRASRRLTLLESADPQNKRVTHLESALQNSLDLKSFIIRT